MKQRERIILHKEEFVKDYSSGKTVTYLMQKFNTKNRHLVLEMIRFFGLQVRPDHLTHAKKYDIDDTYFEKVDSEDKAYFLGLLYADGYNGYKKRCIRLTLSEPDEYILETFKKYLKTTKPLRFYNNAKKSSNWKNAHALNIESLKMCEDLNKLGCHQAKTFSTTFPSIDILPEHLQKHFIRGYFDGDGGVTISKGGDVNINITGTEEILLSIQNILIEKGVFKKTKFSKRHKDRNDNIYTMIYGGNIQTLRFYKYLYEDCNSELLLKRKKEKMEKILLKDVPL